MKKPWNRRPLSPVDLLMLVAVIVLILMASGVVAAASTNGMDRVDDAHFTISWGAINFVLNIVVVAIGFLLKRALDRVSAIELRVQNMMEHLPQAYLSRHDFERHQERMDNSVRDIFRKVDALNSSVTEGLVTMAQCIGQRRPRNNGPTETP